MSDATLSPTADIEKVARAIRSSALLPVPGTARLPEGSGLVTNVRQVNPDPLAPLLELPGVAESVAASRQAVDGLLGHRVLRRRSADVSAESLLRGAWASAVLAGSSASMAEVRAGTATDPIVQGALRVSTELASLAGPWTGAHRQVLARLHALAATDLAPPEQLGRPRPDREVAHRLDTLAEVLAQTRAPAVVIAAIVQAELLSLDAFAPASGVVARGAARLTLIERGNAYAVDGDVYFCVRADADYGSLSHRAGVVGWIRHCGRAIELGARESLAICEAIQRG